MTGIPDELVEKAIHGYWGGHVNNPPAKEAMTKALEAVGLPALLERVEAAEGDAKVWPDDYGWADLMTLLDEHWPGDIFGDTDTPINALRGELAHDAGVRIVALLRWVDALAAKVARVEAVDDRQIRNLGHVMEREQSNARFRDDGRTDERDVAARAAIRWVLALLVSDDPATFRMEPRSYTEYRAALTEGTEG